MAAIRKYWAPETLEEALHVLAAKDAAPLAGGTDLVSRWTKGLAARPKIVVDLKHVAGLRGVRRRNGSIRIGACTPLSEIAADRTIRCSEAPVLAKAADRVACPQIRNRATIGGNLCNASPAADTAIPLILLDALLWLTCCGPNGIWTREVPITEFFRGPGLTVRRPGEILTQIQFKLQPEDAFIAWDKFGTRRAMEIAIASVGVALWVYDAVVVDARVGYGSVAPVPLRGRQAEAQLVGKLLSSEVIGKCVDAAREEIAPITDVRASEAYRREVVGVMLRRMLERARSDRQT